MKKNKYGVAPKVERTYNGIVFHSKAEMTRWCELHQLKLAGEVRNIRRQVVFPLQDKGDVIVKTKKGKVYEYVADFVYDEVKREPMKFAPGDPRSINPPLVESWHEVIEDVKGMKGVGAFKIAVFEALYGESVRIHRRRAAAKKKWKARG